MKLVISRSPNHTNNIMLNIKYHILSILSFVFCQFLFAQSNIEFQQLIGENIPIQSITYAVKQDKNGNLWIASEEGVLKNNSRFYKTYNNYDGLPEKLNNRITQLFIDSKQQIWIGLENDVCKYDKDLDVFKIVKSNSKTNPSSVKCITEDNEGIIWIGAVNGLWKYNAKADTIELVVKMSNIDALYSYKEKLIFGTSEGLFSYLPHKKQLQKIALNSLPSNITTIAFINNSFVIGTKTGKIFKGNLSLNQFQLINFKTNNNGPIKDILKTSAHTIYIATDGDGLYKVDDSFKIISHYREDVNNENSLASNGIYDIELGKENILWIATYGGGINYMDSNKLPFQKIQHRINSSNSIVSNFTRSISKDQNGNLWFGTTKGISILNKKNNSWQHLNNLSHKIEGTQDVVLAFQADGEFMWVGTYNSGLFKININSLKVEHYDKVHTRVYTIFKDSKGNIWVGGIDGNVTAISPQNQISSYPIQTVRSIIETRDGHILAAGKNGIYTINPSTKEVKLIDPLKPNKEILAYSTINSVYETKDERLVIASNGDGLVFYNPKNKQIKKLTIASGMPSDIVQGIIPVNDANFWVSTTKGLAHILTTPKDTIINIFDKKDGLSSTEYNYGSYKKISDSVFAFGGVDGVTLFNPNAIKTQNYKPKVEFELFKLSNKVINPGDKPLLKHINETKSITLKHNENSIEIRFTGISHSSASKVKYSWKLEGFDKEWSTPNLQTIATYTNLSPGQYTFRVKAYNKYSIPGEERVLSIEILSPWWATSLAYVFYFFLLIGIIIAIIHFTSVIIKNKNADEQIDFFNNITHEIKTPLTILIASLDNVTEGNDSGEESKKRIKTTVKRINSLFEQMLNFQKVTSTDNLALDVSKIEVERHILKRVNNFAPLTEEKNIEIIVNNQWGDLPYYFDKDIFDKILLNLISNAIKYSLKGGKIVINIKQSESKELKIEISDDGIGIPNDQQKFILKRYYRARNVVNSQSPGTGLGLMMTKKLLEKTGGSISFVSEENKGTTFSVLLKNQEQEYNKKMSSLQNTLNIDVVNEQLEIDEFSDSKILIVEDNDELRTVLVNTLGVYFQIYEAQNGKEGLEKASQIFPDLILTDLIMPEMDGMQMARELKDDINLNHIPVIMLTVLQNSEQKLESIETGISEYIEKPIDTQFLLAKMINILKWQKKLRDKYIHDTETDTASLFRNKNDQEFLKSLEEKVLENIENELFSVHDLSGSFSMSRTSLYMKLKNLVDLSPQDFIIHTKLKYAKKLLIEGELSIKEVAYRSGFSNPKYFSTSFKKFYDTTPSAFLDSLKKE
ncbi:two-component regulator propeller domain-containing protein [Flavobacterium sp. NG2]|uniref:hybrid sensor histidine kinase/response regulator transcription factor n=1 Tax=Flavobacterium sp. NG2 TaxID=3097547 RepID=UPI002A7F0547|nr:two-component regulator propeller domain-containing protein [Flavobacterium sp. NG2]WPR71953.1 two-component regulator propeller domain-containing protein [Flavobacterium sp. NG2]